MQYSGITELPDMVYRTRILGLETAVDAKCVVDGTLETWLGCCFAWVVQHGLNVLHKPGALAPGGGGESVNADP